MTASLVPTAEEIAAAHAELQAAKSKFRILKAAAGRRYGPMPKVLSVAQVAAVPALMLAGVPFDKCAAMLGVSDSLLRQYVRADWHNSKGLRRNKVASDHMDRLWAKPDFRQRAIERGKAHATRYFLDPENRAKARAALNEHHSKVRAFGDERAVQLRLMVEEGLNASDIGRRLNVTRERARQLLVKAGFRTQYDVMLCRARAQARREAEQAAA
jgi:hypothetical protein